MWCKTHTIEIHGVIQCHNTTNTYKNLLYTHTSMHQDMQPWHTVYIQFILTVLLCALPVLKNCMEGCMTDRGMWWGGGEWSRGSEEKEECEKRREGNEKREVRSAHKQLCPTSYNPSFPDSTRGLWTQEIIVVYKILVCICCFTALYYTMHLNCMCLTSQTQYVYVM
jgi:hypothetical protein